VKNKLCTSWFSMVRLWAIMYVFSYLVFPSLKYFDEEWVSVPVLFERTVVPGAIFLALLGFLAFLFGYNTSSLAPIRSAKLTRSILRQERIWLLWLGTLSAAALIPLWAVRSYGIDFLLFHRDEAFRGEGITLFLSSTLINYSSVFALLLFKFRKSKLVLAAQAVFVLLSSFGSRGLLVVFLLGLGMMSFEGGRRRSMLKRSRLKPFTRYAAIGMCVFTTFGLVFLRQSEDITVYAAKRALTNTFEEGEMFSLVRAQYSNHLLHGQTIWDIRYIFLPRQLFPNKPFIYGKAAFEQDLGLMDIYSPDDPLLGASSVFGQLSELYANFGGAGIVLGMFAWGSIYACIESFREAPVNSLSFFVYLQLFFYQLWFFRHGFLGMVQSLIIPLLLAPVFVKLAYARTSTAHAAFAVSPPLCPPSR